MPENTAPRDVVERLLRALPERDPGLSELYARDAEVDIRFALPDPVRLEGRAALAEHFAAHLAHAPLEVKVENVVIHETADPEVVIAEYDFDGRVTSTGKTFHVPNILVVRVRDGKIASSRDYHNHAVISEALSG